MYFSIDGDAILCWKYRHFSVLISLFRMFQARQPTSFLSVSPSLPPFITRSRTLSLEAVYVVVVSWPLTSVWWLTAASLLVFESERREIDRCAVVTVTDSLSESRDPSAFPPGGHDNNSPRLLGSSHAFSTLGALDDHNQRTIPFHSQL